MNKLADLSAPARLAAKTPGAARPLWVLDRGSTLLLSVIVALMIVYLTVTPDLFVSAENRKFDASASSVSRLLKLGLMGISIVIVLWRTRLAVLMLRWINPFFLMFLVLVPLSALWSISSGATIARYVSILTGVSISLAFTLAAWHSRRLQNVVTPALSVLIGLSMVFAVAFPDLGVEVGEGTLHNAWRGVTSQKNQFGQLASFAVIFWLHALLAKERKMPWAIIGIGASMVCVLLSRSSTSLLATIFSTGFMVLLFWTPNNVRRYMPYVVAMFATILVIYAVAVLKLLPGLDVLLTPITAFTGKDLTFSNRSEIWAIIKEHIELSPYIGSGYGAYWIGPLPGSPSLVFLTRMYFYPGESHNGYLEVTNDLGYIGLAVLMGYLIVYVKDSLALMKLDRNQGILFLSLFFQQAILNLSGSSWLTVNNGFAFFIMTAATTSLGRCLLDHRLKRYYGHPDIVAVPPPRW